MQVEIVTWLTEFYEKCNLNATGRFKMVGGFSHGR